MTVRFDGFGSTPRLTIGYHCSHEQHPPGELLRLVRRAEEAGFGGAMCSDHFHPWSVREGESGFAWSWLGAALQATTLSFGVVTVPGGWRYHPAVLAQAGATLASMFPGRFWMAVGSGEALNEQVVGRGWPAKEERNARLREGVEIMRALWAGETVTRRGRIPVEEAKLYTSADEPPRLVAAALSPETARGAGEWADGLITVAAGLDSVREIVAAFRDGGGAGKPLYLQAQLSFARTGEAAVDAAWQQWRSALFPSSVLAELRVPAQFDAIGAYVRREDTKKRIHCSADPEAHLEWLRSYAAIGFAEIHVHNVCRSEQVRFIDTFGERVLPDLTSASASSESKEGP